MSENNDQLYGWGLVGKKEITRIERLQNDPPSPHLALSRVFSFPDERTDSMSENNDQLFCLRGLVGQKDNSRMKGERDARAISIKFYCSEDCFLLLIFPHDSWHSQFFLHLPFIEEPFSVYAHTIWQLNLNVTVIAYFSETTPYIDPPDTPRLGGPYFHIRCRYVRHKKTCCNAKAKHALQRYT